MAYFQRCLLVAWLVPHEAVAVSGHVLCTPYKLAAVYNVTSRKATYVGCVCVSCKPCHLHFWQNDRDLLRATAVTQGCKGYRNKGQHIKLTMEKKIIPLLLLGSNPGPFDHESGALSLSYTRFRE